MKSLYALAALYVALVAANESFSEGSEMSISGWPQKALSTGLGELGLGNAGGVQVASNASYHRCAIPGQVATMFEGIDVSETSVVLKSIKRQLEVSFFVPSPLLLDSTVIANAQAALRNNHLIGVRFNPAFDTALNTLTPEKVNAEIATAEVQFKRALGRDLQYIMFAYGTPAFAFDVAEKRSIRVVHHNLDFSAPNVNYIATLDANLQDPKHQSFITLQNSHNRQQWDLLRVTYNAALARNFTPVRLTTCLPPLRGSGVDPNALVDVNPKPPVPQPINNNNTANMASSATVQSALVGCAIALALLVFA